MLVTSSPLVPVNGSEVCCDGVPRRAHDDGNRLRRLAWRLRHRVAATGSPCALLRGGRRWSEPPTSSVDDVDWDA